MSQFLDRKSSCLSSVPSLALSCLMRRTAGMPRSWSMAIIGCSWARSETNKAFTPFPPSSTGVSSLASMSAVSAVQQ
eukprot:scaffold2963_cov250-Pinguiococcus_pyrenoidosus.AAC.14